MTGTNLTNRNSAVVSQLNRLNLNSNAAATASTAAAADGAAAIPYGTGGADDYEGWYQDENGEWYQDPNYAQTSSKVNRTFRVLSTEPLGQPCHCCENVFQARPDNYDEGWYQDENGDWLNQYDWHQDEYGEWYYEDSSYEDYDYSADGWYQDENGEWVQDTSLVQNNQTKLANGDVLPGT